MHELVEQFCTALDAFRERAWYGDVQLDDMVRYLGGTAPDSTSSQPDANPAAPLLTPVDRERRYTVDDIRRTMNFLIDRVGMNAGFLVSSLIRLVQSNLELTDEAVRTSVARQSSAGDVQQLFEHFSDRGTLVPKAQESLGQMFGFLQEHLSALPGRGSRQFPLDAWRELVTPLLDTDLMYAELYEELDEDDL